MTQMENEVEFSQRPHDVRSLRITADPTGVTLFAAHQNRIVDLFEGTFGEARAYLKQIIKDLNRAERLMLRTATSEEHRQRLLREAEFILRSTHG